jgi:hypothetical protein
LEKFHLRFNANNEKAETFLLKLSKIYFKSCKLLGMAGDVAFVAFLSLTLIGTKKVGEGLNNS